MLGNRSAGEPLTRAGVSCEDRSSPPRQSRRPREASIAPLFVPSPSHSLSVPIYVFRRGLAARSLVCMTRRPGWMEGFTELSLLRSCHCQGRAQFVAG